MTALQDFRILGSSVSGLLPSCIGNLTSLNSLNVGSTELSGTLVSERAFDVRDLIRVNI